jgi:hypothetical protein
MSIGPVPLALVNDAARIIDDSHVVDKLTEWEKTDQAYRGGRASTLPMRTILIAWLIIALESQPLHISRVAELLSMRLTMKTANALGIPFTQVREEVVYDRVHRATQRLTRLLDHQPLPTRHRRLTKMEWEAVRQDRTERADELERKRLRMFQFTNAILRAQHDQLPAEVRREAISLTVDATAVKSFGRGMGRALLASRRPDQTVPSEPDDGWYIRDSKERDNDGTPAENVKKAFWGREYELVALLSNDPSRPRAVPHIVIGFNHHAPGAQPSASAREIFDDIQQRGYQFDHIVGDQAYLPGSKEDVLQNPLRRAGAKLVMKYPTSPTGEKSGAEGTIQVAAHGAHMVEGTFYCPALPKNLRSVMVDYQKDINDDRKNAKLSPTERATRKLQHQQHRDRQLEERRRWELRRKERPDEHGQVPMRCPAVGPSRTLKCPLKPDQPANLPAGAVPLPVLSPPKAPGDICTHRSSTTFNTDDGSKWQQHYRYGTPEWERAHSYGRQVIESYNSSLKDGGDSGIGDPTRRRLRGATAQAFLVLFAVAATNARRIRQWLDEHFQPGKPAPDRIERHSRTARKTEIRPRASRKRTSPARRARYSPQLAAPPR